MLIYKNINVAQEILQVLQKLDITIMSQLNMAQWLTFKISDKFGYFKYLHEHM